MTLIETLKARIAEIETSAAAELESLHAKVVELENADHPILKEMLQWPAHELKAAYEAIKSHL